MRLFDPANHRPAPVDPNTFTGDATLARMDGVCDDPTVNVYRVRVSTPRAHRLAHP